MMSGRTTAQLARILAPVAEAVVPKEAARRQQRVDLAIGQDGRVLPAAYRCAAQTLVWYYNGTLNLSTHFSQEQRIPQNGTLSRLDAFVKSAPAGSAVTVMLTVNNVSLASVSIASGSTSGSQGPFAVSVEAGDVIRLNITAIGSTTAGANLSVNVLYQPDPM